jgi:hypothetical protein
LKEHVRCCRVYLGAATKVLNDVDIGFVVIICIFVGIVDIFCCQLILVGNSVVNHKHTGLVVTWFLSLLK